MKNLKGRDYSATYTENSVAELPTKEIIHDIRKETLADKKAENKINSSEAVFIVANIERNAELRVPDEVETLVAIFKGLSKEKQAMLSAYAKNLREAEKLEKEANYKPAILPKEIKCESVSDGPARRKQRAPGKNTVRRNYSLSETMANAIQEASQLRGITASLYVEEVMAQQPEVREVLKLAN